MGRADPATDHPEEWIGGVHVPASTRQELTWRAEWAILATCPFCFAPWAVLVSLVWAWASGLDASSWAGALWWLAHIWLAVSYAASMLVLRDEPPEES